MRLFGAFQKVEELANGTLFVAGVASSESVDAAGEVIKADAMKAALPDFMKFGTGNLREMHQLIAAGTIDKIEVQDDGATYIETIVVDPVAITKVKTGVYKGFSIGGKATARDKLDKTQITGVRLSEISLVDRPCNPDAVITLFKIDNAEEADMAKTAADPSEKEAIDALAKILNDKTLSPQQIVALANAEIAKAEAAGAIVVTTAAEPAAAAPDPAAVVTKAAKLAGDALKKGMYGLSDFASLLNSVKWLTEEAEWEAQVEGDGSKVPQALREWLAAGATIFSTMAAEEVAELVASVQPKIALADAAADVVKIDDPAAPAPVIEPPAPATETPIAKVDDPDTLMKAELAKRDELLAKAQGAIDTLTKRLEVLEAQPLPGKALLKAIGKGGDVVAIEQNADVAPVQKADGSTDEAATLIKSLHSQGGIRIGFPTT